MCGIAGIFSYKKSADIKLISEMTDSLSHRGPDDEGFLAADWNGQSVYHLVGPDSTVAGTDINTFNTPSNLLLGHRRLSILDPTPMGHQPMCNRDGSVWIVFNGEIYNYIELREQLRSKGHEFRTNTDTEVLLASYEQWGEECLQKFNGMWSFVIYDRRSNSLFGARDRFGVKPLYYYLDQEHFTFASELKALLRLPFIDKGINHAAIFDYLVIGYQDHEAQGFISNILELEPSFAFQFNIPARSFRKWKYFSLEYTNQWEDFNSSRFTDHMEKVRELLIRAITIRLRSDVPVGSCLSGGLDSSTIVSTINKLLENEALDQIGDRQKVFTACYNISSLDESSWAKMVVEQTKTSWHKTFPESGDLLEDLEDLVYTQDTPFGSTSIYAQYRVMKLAAGKGVKVLLDGQGGDEIFTGYTPLYGPFFAEMIKNMRLSCLSSEWKSLDNSPVSKSYLLKSLINIAGARALPSMLREKAYRLKFSESRYLNPDLWHSQCHRLSLITDKAKTSLNEKLLEYLVGTNLKSLLRYEDRNSMRFSIESRTPFADDLDLIEYVFKMPAAYKIHQGWSKHILREAAAGLIPEKIRLRKDKVGFVTPESYWMQELRDSFRSYINNDVKDFINLEELFRDWNRMADTSAGAGINILWRIINLAVWKKVYSL